MIYKRQLPILLLLGGISCLHSTPSVLLLDSGEQLIGDVLPHSTEETIFIRSAVLGEVQLPRDRVKSMEVQGSPQEADVAALEPKTDAPAEYFAKNADPSLTVAPTSIIVADTKSSQDHLIDALREFKAPEDWSGDLRFGVNVSNGDRRWTETFAHGKLEIEPEETPNFFRFTGSYTYRETERSDGEKFRSTDKYDSEFVYRRSFMNNNFFVQNALGGRVDRIKDIDLELQESIGIGYHYKPNAEFDLLFGSGGGVEDFKTELEDTREGLNPLMNIFQ